MGRTGKPVRMADIAEKLDISVVSVSKALSGKPGVSDEMRAKIVALAQEMGYEMRREASAGGDIGVLVADRMFSDNSFYAKLYRSLSLHCAAEGLTCILEIVPQEAEKDAVPSPLIKGQRVDGVIFMGNISPDYVRAVADHGIPCLLLDFRFPGSRAPCVISDNIDGGYALTKHLLDLGINEIAYVGSIQATSSIMERYLGYQQALRDASIIPREDWLLEDRDENGVPVPISLPIHMPKAFVCNCDETAFHLVNTLRRAGYQVPESVAVTGYDDFRFATVCQPPLTTYCVDMDQMADTVVEMISQKLRQETSPVMLCVVPGHLIVRESTTGFRGEDCPAP